MAQDSTDNSGAWFTIATGDNSNGPMWPSNGVGGKTATAASSPLVKANRVVLMGVKVNFPSSGVLGGVVTIFAHDGTTTLFTFPFAAGTASTSILLLPPVLEGGLGIPITSGQTCAGISAKVTGTSNTADIAYRDTGW